QHLGSNTIAGRSGVIHDILGAADQRFMVATRIEEATMLLISKQRDRLVHQPARLRKPARIKACLVKGKQPIGEESVVFQVAVQTPAPIFECTQYSSIATQLTQQEPGIIDGNPQVIRTAKVTCRLCKATQHQPIPRGQNLLITSWLYPLL